MFAAPLQQNKRLLIIYADKPGNILVDEQLNFLKADMSGIRERDIRIQRYYAIFSKNEFVKRGIKGTFTVVLVGKDGGDKLQSTTPITLQKLYETIDAMPMRREEMKRHP
jgi:hypothetical protein